MNQQRSATMTAPTIAGSDPSGGAGIQTDMRAMSTFGPYTMSVITASTARSTRDVASVYAVLAKFVHLQMDTLLEDIVPDATKIGMLTTVELIDVVGEHLSGPTHTMLGPVMVTTFGDRLLGKQTIGTVCHLCTRAGLTTPNLYEATVLLGEEPVATLGELRNQVQRLGDLSARRILVKGGYPSGDTGDAVDAYVDTDGVETLCGRRISTQNAHDMGCTLSSVIASLRPHRATWLEAIQDTKDHLASTITHAEAPGAGHKRGPAHHFYRVWTRTGW